MTFDQLLRYFTQRDRSQAQPSYKPTEIGQYLPSSLEDLHDAFSILRQRGFIQDSQHFLDAGSGDGRVVALAALHGLQGYGIEYDAQIAAYATENMENLRPVLNGSTPRVVQGDFCKDAAYDRLGAPFQTFPVVFNFINNQSHIAWRVANHSPRGTIFLLHEWGNDNPEEFPGLEYEDTVRIKPLADYDFLVHVYRRME